VPTPEPAEPHVPRVFNPYTKTFEIMTPENEHGFLPPELVASPLPQAGTPIADISDSASSFHSAEDQQELPPPSPPASSTK
jgi:hypothetical protein